MVAEKALRNSSAALRKEERRYTERRLRQLPASFISSSVINIIIIILAAALRRRCSVILTTFITTTPPTWTWRNSSVTCSASASFPFCKAFRPFACSSVTSTNISAYLIGPNQPRRCDAAILCAITAFTHADTPWIWIDLLLHHHLPTLDDFLHHILPTTYTLVCRHPPPPSPPPPL